MRKVISLDGDWGFRHESDLADRRTPVPMPWQAAFADLRQSSGRARYWRGFAHPGPGEAVLRFGAVSYLAEVFVNGHQIGRHEGGYLPFDCVIPPEILRDANDLEVRCLLPDDSPNEAGLSFAEIPHGKQSWYGPIGGIWQGVTLELRDPTHLSHCAIAADPSGHVSLTLTLPEAALGAMAYLAIFDARGIWVELSRPVASTTIDLDVVISDPLAWSPDAPHLYRLEVALTRDRILDHTRHSFGLRRFEARDGQLFLNGRPWYMRAALDQDYYPEGICTPPSVEFLEDQMRKAKALGLNMLRCHIKVPDPRYYEVADRLGMLIWTEVPNVGRFTRASAARMKETMRGILERDGNHPSIVIWTLINEAWGTRLDKDAGQRRWLAAMYDWLKALDPTRLVCDNSPCQGNFHVKGDLDDFHYYRSVPDWRAEWDQLTAELAAGADWTWTPFGDGARRGDEPKLVSEFGVWGLPQPGQVQIDGAEPWWTETGTNWGEGAALPHGIEARFARVGLDRVFGSLAQFVVAAQWHQFANLKYQIETIRAWPQIQGYCITELTDVHWESNGLMDMNRNPRVFHDRFAEVNADVVIVPRVGRHSGTAGEGWGFDVAVASGGLRLGAGVLRWTVGAAGGTLAFPGAEPLATIDLGRIDLILPQTAQNRMLTVTLALEVDGRILQRNQVDMALYAPRVQEDLAKVACRGEGLARRARALGYQVVAPEAAEVILTEALEPDDLSALRAGARYLVLAGSAVPDVRPLLPGGVLPDLATGPRDGTIWRGDWIGSFAWVRREGAFADLPGGPLIDLSFSGVAPRRVLHGWDAAKFDAEVASGLVVGWVHKPVALIARKDLGKGGFVATTFRVQGGAAGEDPVADALFDGLVADAAFGRGRARGTDR
ncbi:glycoside hydrolase family 2 [bacterium]|nr:glycoside hydrolase family 2 [bacterium]